MRLASGGLRWEAILYGHLESATECSLLSGDKKAFSLRVLKFSVSMEVARPNAGASALRELGRHSLILAEKAEFRLRTA
jgi:hypothetical protein